MEKVILEATRMIENRKVRIAELRDAAKNFDAKDTGYLFIYKQIWLLEDEIDYIKNELKDLLRSKK